MHKFISLKKNTQCNEKSVDLRFISFGLFCVYICFQICMAQENLNQNSRNCDKCVDNTGESCDYLLKRFEQSRYWVPLDDALGFGFTFAESKYKCENSGFTLAVLKYQDDLRRAIQMVGYDHYWMQRQHQNSTETTPVALSKHEELTPLSLNNKVAFVCEFLDGSPCMVNMTEPEPSRDEFYVEPAYIPKPKMETEPENQNVTTTKVQVETTTENITTITEPPRKRRKCKSLLFGNRLSIKS